MNQDEIEKRIEKLSKSKLEKLLDILNAKIVSFYPDKATVSGADVLIHDILFRLFQDYSEEEILKALGEVEK